MNYLCLETFTTLNKIIFTLGKTNQNLFLYYMVWASPLLHLQDPKFGSLAVTVTSSR